MAGVRDRGEFDQPIPARGVAGGEGQGGREVQGLEAHLLVCLGAREGDQRGLVGEEQGAAAEVNDDDSVPTRERRG